MASDHCEGLSSDKPFQFGSKINVAINLFSSSQIESLSSTLSHNGVISVPLSMQMWGAYFTEFCDQYSVNWYLNMQVPQEGSLTTAAPSRLTLLFSGIADSKEPMQLSPYLRFNGRCKEAMTEYQRVLGGTLEFNVRTSLVRLIPHLLSVAGIPSL
jgi:uncharacterized glyoxalase superfamily protein PhnB